MAELTRKDIAAIRKKIKAEFPNLKFTIKKTSFQDLARDTAYFVESDEWGMTKVGSHHLFKAVEQIVKEHASVYVSW
jgi:hypothetical protein